MPSRLQSARADRGWSQPQLIQALVNRARTEGFELPGRDSLKTMVSRWENGKAKPDEFYLHLLCQVYGLTEDELGLRNDGCLDTIPQEAVDEITRSLDTAKAITPEMVRRLQDQTDTFRTLDRPMGAPPLLGQVRGHVSLLCDLMRAGVLDGQRKPVAAVLADAAALAAWQALDVGAVAQSWQHFETAKAAAREAEDPALLAHATAEQAYVLMDLDRLDDAVALIGQARGTAPGRLPGQLRCWLGAVHGEALAQLGEQSAALGAFDHAVEALTAGDDDRTPYLVLSEAHLARWRGNVLTRLRHHEAVPCLTGALAQMDGSFRRATASLHCDLAIAHLTRGDRDSASCHASQGRTVAGQVGSVRQLRRLARLGLAA